MEWTIHEVAERAGISPRTLRHYHQIGLLVPDRIGTNGYRYYGSTSIAHLQRILQLRETGMSLADIATALEEGGTCGAENKTLNDHLAYLSKEQKELARRITAVRNILMMRREGKQPRMNMVLEGFNDRYEDEVIQRWGHSAFEQSNRWWHTKSIDEQRRFQANTEKLLAQWGELHGQGLTPTDTTTQDHAAMHVAWFAQIPGTPLHAGDIFKTAAMLRCIANLYATNPDFYSAFGGSQAAVFASEALHHYADENYPID
ncbi:MerR family transcriptional regulator [Rothia sp. CCM 9417]|uniref:MerR family transcriptional regulator n=1 Tax=Rothia sp. CCM 9417 TaxID=3402657 RepID=UPI003AE34114